MYGVSVVIPVRNRENFIRTSVQSVLSQTCQNFEIIIVDDCSSDGTVSVVAGLAREDDRIRLLEHGSRRGAQAARNTGIRAANGQWIAFLDSDDQWLPDSLESRLQLAIQDGLHVVHSECYVLRPESTELRLYGVPRLQGTIYKELLRHEGPMFQGMLVSKEAITRVGLLDETIVSHQEWDTSIRLAKYYKFGFVAEPTYVYDCRHADTISKDLLRDAKGYEQVISKHFWSLLRYLAPRGLARHYQKAAALYRTGKDEDGVRRCATKAFLLWPFRARTILSRIHGLVRSGT
jgi:glycosyltransferase involved in cell wall biosynthesis